MNTFPFKAYDDNIVCPFCGTADARDAVLVPISGTAEGNNIQAIQIHVNCITDQWLYIIEYNAIIVIAKKPPPLS